MAARAGLLDRWSHALDADEDLAWRSLLQHYANCGRPPQIRDIANETGIAADRLASLSELKNGAPTIDQRESEVRQMKSVLCPTCGCSLVRLQITRKEATHLAYDGADYYFCCTGCAELFAPNPESTSPRFATLSFALAASARSLWRSRRAWNTPGGP